MMNHAINAATDLRKSSTDETFRIAKAFTLLLVGMILAYLVIALMFSIPISWSMWVLLALVGVGGFTIGAIVFVAWLKGMGQEERVVKVAENLANAEIALKTAALPTLPTSTPASAPEQRVIPHTINGRGGEIAVDLVDDWLDPRDAEWFASYLANGNKWTETLLEKMPMPFGGQLIGRDREGTPYRKLMQKCTSKEIITGRGGPGNLSGTLAIKDEKEIARRLKEKL